MRRLLAGLLLAGLAMFWLAGQASAHNVLERSDPADGSSVTAGPPSITLVFNEDVQQGPNKITVTGPDGKQWQANNGDATVDGDTVTNRLRPLGPKGKYTVGYHIISADGHPLSGSVAFTLTKQGNGTPNPNAVQPSEEDSGGVPIWVWIGGAVVLLVVGMVVAMRAGRES